MSAIGRFLEALAAWRAPPVEPDAPLREAAGVTVDPDEDQWRRLSGRSERDLRAMTQHRMQKTAVWLWEANPVANRLIELPIASTLR